MTQQVTNPPMKKKIKVKKKKKKGDNTSNRK